MSSEGGGDKLGRAEVTAEPLASWQAFQCKGGMSTIFHSHGSFNVPSFSYFPTSYFSMFSLAIGIQINIIGLSDISDHFIAIFHIPESSLFILFAGLRQKKTSCHNFHRHRQLTTRGV